MKIYSEIEYINEENQTIHSDLNMKMSEDTREIMHKALDEWLNNSKGTGAFYITGDKETAKIFRNGI